MEDSPRRARGAVALTAGAVLLGVFCTLWSHRSPGVQADAGCLSCHRGIETASASHEGCVSCHGGNPDGKTKEAAHAGIYGIANPSFAGRWELGCKPCHRHQVERVNSNQMFTNTGHDRADPGDLGGRARGRRVRLARGRDPRARRDAGEARVGRAARQPLGRPLPEVLLALPRRAAERGARRQRAPRRLRGVPLPLRRAGDLPRRRPDDEGQEPAQRDARDEGPAPDGGLPRLPPAERPPRAELPGPDGRQQRPRPDEGRRAGAARARATSATSPTSPPTSTSSPAWSASTATPRAR